MIDFVLFITTTMLKSMFVISGLLPILNPPGHAPLFLSATKGMKKEERKKIAKTSAVYCFFLIVSTMFIGVYILSLFDLSIDVVEVSGGILVAKLGWDMLGDENPESPIHNAEGVIENTDPDMTSKSFYPIAFPLTVGPGTISVAIALSANLQSSSSGIKDLSAAIVGALLATSIVCFTIYTRDH
ncbi:MarC family protein [Serratia bockelmannii]|uniref:MarC family protein n=1 Tax=Serratia bockelmannii TaxID=2703793 RepID=UPI00313EF314